MSDPVKKSVEPQNPIGAYRKTDVMTANKETILLMLYNGALRFLKRAMEAEEKQDKPERNKWILRTQEIVNELRSTLNFEVGGELAQNLDGLYGYCTRVLSETMMEEKPDGLKTVHQILSTLLEGWEQAIDTVKKDRTKAAEETK